MTGDPIVTPVVRSNGLSRFFDRDRTAFYSRGEVEVLLSARIQEMLDGLYAARLITRRDGFLRARLADGLIAAEVGFGTARSPYDEVVAGKDELAEGVRDELGFGTRYAQQVGTLWLRGDNIVHYGSFEQDGLTVCFSGVQAFWDEKIALMAWGLIAGLNDLRASQLQPVRVALGLRWYWEAMNAIEAVAEHFGYTTIEEAVQRIVEDHMLDQARDVLVERARTGEQTRITEVRGMPVLAVQDHSGLVATVRIADEGRRPADETVPGFMDL